MLLTGTETLHLAAKRGWALGAFAVYNLEMVQAIVTAAEEADRPGLLLAGSSHFHHAGQTALMNIALTAAHSTSAPVGVHLDHCRDLPEMQRCLDAGYSSVMIDGSHLSFEDNIRFTQEAAALAHRAGAWIEAELGAVPGDEDGSTPLQRSARFPWSCTARADCRPDSFEAPSPVALPRSTSTLNCAAPTSPQSKAHCRRRCRTPTPSRYGGRDAPPSRPRRDEPSTRCHPSADHCHSRKAQHDYHPGHHALHAPGPQPGPRVGP